jgi:predicted RND superfamily exporter protein
MATNRDENVEDEIHDRASFDSNSGGRLERLVFNHRLLVVLLCLLATLGLGYEALQLKVNANFERMIPQNNPYIRNYLDNKAELPGLGNAVRIVVETTEGDILDPSYLDQLRKISDTVYLIPGVDRSWMKSLWTPLVRWMEVTEQGQVGGPVMPEASRSCGLISPKQTLSVILSAPT